jgi:hypothetical protein
MAACCIALIAPFGKVVAQEARPAEPDTIRVPGRVTGAPAYLRSFIGLPSVTVSADGGYVAMLTAGPTASTLDTMRVRAMSPTCFQPATAGDLPPGSDSESVALGGQALVIVVLGAHKGSDCQIEWNLHPLTLWRAASQPGVGEAPARVPLAARLRVDGVPAEPLRAYTRPAYRRTAAGWARDGNQLRYYYDPSIVAPRANGQPRELTVDVWDRAALPTNLEFEQTAAERLALESIAMRLAVGADSSPTRPLELRSSRTIALKLGRMLDSSANDATRAGIGAASWASSARQESEQSVVIARLVSAEALLGQRKDDLAKGVVAGVMREHPCLVPPTGSSPSLVELARSNRKAGQCEPVTTTKALTLGIVPGMGSLAVHDRRGAAIGASLVAIALGGALMLNHQANQRYAEYRTARDPEEAETIYQAARDLRSQRGVALGVAGGVWVLDALWAAHVVGVHNRKIADDRF